MSGEPSVTRSEHPTHVSEDASTQETPSTETFRRSSSVASTDSTDSFSPPGLGTYKYRPGNLETESTRSQPHAATVPLVLVQENLSSRRGASSGSTPSSEHRELQSHSIPSQESSIPGLDVYKRTSNLRERSAIDSGVPTSPFIRQHIQHPFEPQTPTRAPRKWPVDTTLIDSSTMRPIYYVHRPVDLTPTKDPRKRPVDTVPIGSSPMQPIYYGRSVDSTPTKDPRKRPIYDSVPMQTSSPSALQWNHLSFISPMKPVRDTFNIISGYRQCSEEPQSPTRALHGRVENVEARNEPLPPIQDDQHPDELQTPTKSPVLQRPKPYSPSTTSSSTTTRFRRLGTHTVDMDSSDRYPELHTQDHPKQ